MNKKLNITLIRPAGNDTALVEGILSKEERISTNQLLMRKFPTIEQVGFYEKIDTKTARLEMAGGEFCGNALRSLAYLLLKGKKGELSIQMSGVPKPLKTGVKELNTSFARMPICNSFSSVQIIDNNIYKVEMYGITHLISLLPQNSDEGNLKKLGKQMLEDAQLLYSQPACGVMYISKDIKEQLSIQPIVWVRDIQTLFLESACASGTTAVGLWQSSINKLPKTKLSVKQPSNQLITVEVTQNNQSFIDASINGPIQIIQQQII